MSTTIIYPAFALSLILNLMMGGKLMSGISNSADSLNEESVSKDEDAIDTAVQYGPSTYGYIDDYEDSNPLAQLERIRQERESMLGKKSEFDYLRNTDFHNLAYSYK